MNENIVLFLMLVVGISLYYYIKYFIRKSNDKNNNILNINKENKYQNNSNNKNILSENKKFSQEQLLPKEQDENLSIKKEIKDIPIQEEKDKTDEKINHQPELTEKEKKLEQEIRKYKNIDHRKPMIVGRMYERYLCYCYETKYIGCKVVCNGILKGKKDGGIDLIITFNNQVRLIQAKCWEHSKIISVNIMEKFVEDIKNFVNDIKYKTYIENIKGIFIHTCEIEEQGKIIAEQNNIEIANIKYNKNYPLIKCKRDKNIYYLPYEIDNIEANRNYDSINIDLSQGDEYLHTIREAKQKGYRRDVKNRRNKRVIIYQAPDNHSE